MNKKIYEEENNYLSYINNKIKKEIENCKQELKEIPKRHTNILQGDAFLVEGLMSTMATQLKKLELSKNSPYFGRIDFKDKSKDTHKIYIGKVSVVGEDGKPAITDWRAPICNLYYNSELGKVSYEAPEGTVTGEMNLKRQIIIENAVLKDAQDTSIVSSDELLNAYLNVNADTKMKTIIASIQKEQNKIIRENITKNIIVQGVAGSGKTSVALHRIAYLIYALGKKSSSNEYLVIGPNEYFLNYISSILPELETEPVKQKTYLDLVNNYLNEKLSLENQNIIFEKNDDVDSLKRIQAYKTSLSYKKAIDKFLYELSKGETIKEGITFEGQEIYDRDKVISILLSGISKQLDYEKASKYFTKNFKDNFDKIYDKLNEKYRSAYMKLTLDNPKRKELVQQSTDLKKTLKQAGPKTIKSYFKKLQLKPLDMYKLFIANIDNYAGDELTEKDKLIFQRDTLLSLKKRKVGFEDLAALLHINTLTTGQTKNFKSVVIDEAQDYGMFHFEALKELFPNAKFSIYGDIAQSIYEHRSIKRWQDVAEVIFNNNCEIEKLSKSYRTTEEITTNANQVLNQLNLDQATPVIRHGNKVTIEDATTDSNYKFGRIAEWVDKGYKSIAVICKTEDESKKVCKDLKKQGLPITNITEKDQEYNGGIFTITSAASKGLEFDAVMINDASANIYDESNTEDMHLLYVASTRALHELDILYNKELTPVFNKQKESNKVFKKTK